jgi:S1-C subfamily serine protease
LYQDSGSAWLGVRVQDNDAGVVVVDVVSGSPADEAGLQHGDVITAVNGSELASSDDLVSMIQTLQVGEEVTLSVTSGDESKDVTVTLAERPEEYSESNTFSFRGEAMLTMFGVSATLTDEGLQIDSIDADSPLADSGLQAGDVITAVDGADLSSLNPRDLMQQLRDTDQVTLTVQRGGEEVDVTLDITSLRDQMGDLGNMIPMMPGQQGNNNMMPGMMFGMSNGYLGVAFLPVTADLATEQNLTVQAGALIEEVVDGSPAADAGLQVGDVVTAVNGESVDEEHTLRDRLIAYEPDDVVTLTVQRGDQSLDVEATLGEPQGGFMGGMMPGQQGGFFWMPNDHPFMQPDAPQTEPAQPSDSAGPSA